MTAKSDKRFGIADVSRITKVSPHLLRQWESRFTHLKPKRDGANRRSYTMDDVNIVRRIKELVRHEKLTSKGVQRRLTQELLGEGRPMTNQEVITIIDSLQAEVRGVLDLLDDDDDVKQ